MPLQRVVLKISGEALRVRGDGPIFDHKALEFLAVEIASIIQTTQLAIVIGGGNIVRGRYLTENFRTTPVVADHIGMVATIANALLLEDFLTRIGVETRVLSSIPIDPVAEPYIFKRAVSHLDKGRVIVIAGGTGNAGVTTDTAAVLKACDLGAKAVLKGTKVDGVYDRDPNRDAAAVFLPELTYNEFLQMGLTGILDETAVAQAKMKDIPIIVFNIFKPGNLKKAVEGREIGSLIS